MIQLAKNSALDLPEGKSKLYYELLKKGTTDKKAVEALYPATDTWAKQKFQNLKSALKKKMIADIASSSNTVSGATKTHIEAHQAYSAASVLIAKGIKQAGIDIMKTAFLKARKAHITGVAMLAAKELALHYAVIAGDQKKYERYRQENERLQNIHKLESKAQLYYSEISSAYNHKWKVEGNVKEQALKYAREIQQGIEGSIRLGIYYFNILAFGYLSENEHEQVLDVCRDADAYFADYNGNRATRFTFLIKRIVALIELKRYQDAEAAIQDALGIAITGKYNYHVAYFYLGIVGLHSSQVEKAKQAIDKTKPEWKDLPSHFQEQWRLLEAYLAFLSENGFRIGRFLNQVPKFSKDKAGANAAIITVQMLHFLKEGRTDDFIDHCEAIEQYSRRHLSGRARIFVRMLLQIPKGRFNAMVVRQRVKKLKWELENEARKEIEIVPYEVLWERAMAIMKVNV